MPHPLKNALIVAVLLATLAGGAGLAGEPATVHVYDGAGNMTGVINTGTDADNCGGVGSAFDCSSSHITPACAAAVCSGTCAAGWADCNANKLADGCETSTTTTANCGVCGRVCPARPNSTTTCASGTCTSTCLANWGNCNGVAADGCETLLTSSVGLLRDGTPPLQKHSPLGAAPA